MNELSWAAIKDLVHERANGCCEYCQTSEENSGQTLQVDHIYPTGGNGLENLCLACWNCNNYKRATTQVIDPETSDSVSIFNPRAQIWSEHFEWINGATIVRGITATGRASVERLKMNRSVIVVARQRWVNGGYHPPMIKLD
jgi:HNH endonuclease